MICFQYLIGALLVSQQRADELELRGQAARRLPGRAARRAPAHARPARPDDRAPQRRGRPLLARDRARRPGSPRRTRSWSHTAGLLHDIGKFVLPDRILKGDAELTEADWEEIKKHPNEGARIVSQIDGYQPVGEIILAHHERLDGLGYPRGLTGEEIPDAGADHRRRRHLRRADGPRLISEPGELVRGDRPSCAACAGTQLDARFVEILAEVLVDKDFAYRHGEDADFEAELALDRRIHEYATAGTTPAGPRLPYEPRPRRLGR